MTVDQAVNEALSRNLYLLAQRLNISVADAQIMTARLRPNPIFSLSSDHLDLLGTAFIEVNNASPPEYSGRVDFLLKRGGKRQARIGVASATKTVVEYMLLDTARSLIFGRPVCVCRRSTGLR